MTEPLPFLIRLMNLASQLPGSSTRGSNAKRSGYKTRLGHRLLSQLEPSAMRLAQQEAAKRQDKYKHSSRSSS